MDKTQQLRGDIEAIKFALKEIGDRYRNYIGEIKPELDKLERELAQELAPDIHKGMKRIYQDEVVTVDYMFMGEGRYGEEYVGVVFDYASYGSASLPVETFRNLPLPEGE